MTGLFIFMVTVLLCSELITLARDFRDASIKYSKVNWKICPRILGLGSKKFEVIMWEKWGGISAVCDESQYLGGKLRSTCNSVFF